MVRGERPALYPKLDKRALDKKELDRRVHQLAALLKLIRAWRKARRRYL